MREYHLFHIAICSASFLLCVTCLFFTLIRKRTAKVHNKIYVAMLLILMSNSLCEIVGGYSRLLGLELITAERAARFIYFLFHNALPPLLFYYMYRVCGARFDDNKRRMALFNAGFALPELLLLTNPLTGWFYYYDEQQNFCRNWGEMIAYITAACFVVLALIKLFRSWDALTDKKRMAIIYFFFISALGLTIQLAHSEIKAEIFAECLGMLGLMLCIESEDDRIDIESGFYNRKALRQDIKSYVINKRDLFLVGLRITDSDSFIQSTGSENSDILTEILADFLCSIAPRFHIYSVNPSTFALTVYGNDEAEIRKFAEKITERFEQPWDYRGTQMKLSAVVMAAALPARITSVSDALFMLDSALPQTNDKQILINKDLEYLLRRSAVEDAVSRGLDEHSFYVCYQPTYSMKTRKLHGAEALLRMNDRELGVIYPDEFIPVAEHMGLIDRIDSFVLSEVCRFIGSGVPRQYGMECINVNLSVIECMKPGFTEHINSIVEAAGIGKGFLNFEITESVAANDYKTLSSVITSMKNEGFLFSMDDYGTGYSNLIALLSLNLDVIKIDKSILWEAQSSEYGHIMLENSVRMFRQMNRRILVEGVETGEQIELLESMDVDYLQGYYFSKPLPENEFIEFISR